MLNRRMSLQNRFSASRSSSSKSQGLSGKPGPAGVSRDSIAARGHRKGKKRAAPWFLLSFLCHLPAVLPVCLFASLAALMPLSRCPFRCRNLSPTAPAEKSLVSCRTVGCRFIQSGHVPCRFGWFLGGVPEPSSTAPASRVTPNFLLTTPEVLGRSKRCRAICIQICLIATPNNFPSSKIP